MKFLSRRDNNFHDMMRAETTQMSEKAWTTVDDCKNYTTELFKVILFVYLFTCFSKIHFTTGFKEHP